MQAVRNFQAPNGGWPEEGPMEGTSWRQVLDDYSGMEEEQQRKQTWGANYMGSKEDKYKGYKQKNDDQPFSQL